MPARRPAQRVEVSWIRSSVSEGAAQGQRQEVSVGQGVALAVDGIAAGKGRRVVEARHSLADVVRVIECELPYAEIGALYPQRRVACASRAPAGAGDRRVPVERVAKP